ncbi:hypothetical protein ABPG72_009433 [Tetrahymena utriculariae]
MNDFFQINSSSSVPIFKRKQVSLNKGADNEASLDTAVECLSLPNYMRNINDIKKISKWMIKNTELFSKIHSYRLQKDALKNEDEDNLIIAILCSSNLEIFQECQTLFNIKDKPEKMYIILEGTVEVFVQPKQLHSLTSLIKSKEISSGKSVGDMDLFSNANRNSTVIAKKKCIFLSIKKNIFDAHIQEFYQYCFTDIMNFIFNLKAFDGISNKHLFIKSFYDAYSQQLKYSQGQLVFSEKNQPDCVYFVLTGTFLVNRQINQEKLRTENQNKIFSPNSQNSKTNSKTQNKSEFDLNINDQKTYKIQINLFELVKGDFFGEEDIIENNPYRTFQVQCTSILGGELLQFNREVFENIFMKHFTIEQFFVLNLPIKRNLIADKIYQNQKIFKATIPKDNNQHQNYFDIEKRESRYQVYTSLDSMNNIASQKSQNINNFANQQYDKNITSLSCIPKHFDEIQEEKDQQNDVKNNHQRNQRNFKINCIGSMSELLDYAQQSIEMLHQNQQNTNFHEQQNQISDSTIKQSDTIKSTSSKMGLYYLPTQKQRISSNDLCYQIQNQSDENLKKQQTINSIKKKMSQTFDYNMNNFMRDKIQLSKNVVFQQRKNKQKMVSVHPQKQNDQRSKSDENQISTLKTKSKPTVTKWTNSLNLKDDEMIMQGEMSKQFQKNLKQICYKFGKQDFNSLKMSLKNHIKDKNFQKILNANISNAKGFQINHTLNYDRSKGMINDISEKIQYVQRIQDKMSQRNQSMETSIQNEQDPIQNQQFNQNEFQQLQNTQKSKKSYSQYYNQNQIQSKAQLNQTLNSPLGYFQQYIIHPQQQNIKYHFHSKVISDVSKNNINSNQLSKFFQQPTQSNNNNISNSINSYQIKQPAYLHQSQQFQQQKMQNNHSAIMNNTTNQQCLNILSRESQQQAEINKQENQLDKSHPTLFSPDIFYSPQHLKKQNKFISLNHLQKGGSLDLKDNSQQQTIKTCQYQIKTPKYTFDQLQQAIQSRQQTNETPKQKKESVKKTTESQGQTIKKNQQSVEPQQIIEKLQQVPQKSEQNQQINEEEKGNQPNNAQKTKVKKNRFQIEIPPNKINIDFQLMLENQKQKQIEEDSKIESPPHLKSNQTNSYENQTPQFQVKNFNFQAKQISLNSSIQSQKQSQDIKTSLHSINQDDNLEQNNNQEDISKTKQKTSIQLISQSQINNSNSLEYKFQNKQHQSNSSQKDFNLQKKANSQQSIIETINCQHQTSNQDQSSVNNKSSVSEQSQKLKSQKQIQNKSIEQENSQLKNNLCKNDQSKGQQNPSQFFKSYFINSSIPIINEESSFEQFNQEQNNQGTLNKLMLNGSMTSNISQFQNLIDPSSLVRYSNASQYSTSNINDQTSKQKLIDAPSLIRFRNASQFSINNINDQVSKQHLMDAPSLISFRKNTQFSINNINDQISKQNVLFGQNELVYLTKANKNQITQQNMLIVPHNSKDTNNYQIQNHQIVDDHNNYPIRQKSKSAYNKL